MRLYRITPLLIIFFSLINVVNAQTITVGVMPSVVELNLYSSPTTRVTLNFFNDKGDTDAIYSLNPDSCLKSILVSYPKEVTVPKGTDKVSNPVKVDLQFKTDYKGDETCMLIVTGKPVGVNISGTATVLPSVGIKFNIHQKTAEEKTNGDNYNIIDGNNHITTTTTTINNTYQTNTKPPNVTTTIITNQSNKTNQTTLSDQNQTTQDQTTSFPIVYILIFVIIVMVVGVVIYYWSR